MLNFVFIFCSKKFQSLGTSDPESVKSVTRKGHLCVDLYGFLFVRFSSFVCAHFSDKESELVRKRGRGRERVRGCTKSRCPGTPAAARGGVLGQTHPCCLALQSFSYNNKTEISVCFF